jgi:hypothetical protein
VRLTVPAWDCAGEICNYNITDALWTLARAGEISRNRGETLVLVQDVIAARNEMRDDIDMVAITVSTDHSTAATGGDTRYRRSVVFGDAASDAGADKGCE